MPAKDIYHQTVINALTKDGWVITNDPLTLQWGERNLFVDLAAERVVTAEKAGRKIAVEIKSFIGGSDIYDLQQALGQYQMYRSILARTQTEFGLYLAVTVEVFQNLFENDVGKLLLEDYSVSLIIFNDRSEEIVQWII